MKKTTYKKIAKDTFEEISETLEVVGVIKLEQIEKTRDYYFNQHKKMDDLYKKLKKLKVE